ncbi:NAD(P)/FAD-dependent oxidoreductase [Cryobacterium frigoriphilum]|uniref:NAD(P)/FAD-dependent oxidoreductase n=1 Tax=Cryobacterium frigoriphilum TaxID=1259150 RepID=A0A4R9AB16_9MICO|nr:NAD(P)-binding domain-containing protein [Cryobacterium frigoriphilum]TFD55562.1 NAD(P)/FAD-dependent oxidoreductase [Cryobacterium frigoriphilum]
MPSDASAPVVIVGAGQAGLSVAYYLRSSGLVAGRDFVIFDRGPQPGGAWQHRWPALKLGTAHRVNDLPGLTDLGLSFENADRARPASEVVTEYYRRYEQHFELAVVRPVAVSRVGTRGPDLVVDTTSALYGDHRTTTQILVNATGTWGAPFRPHYAGAETFRGRQLHTSDYRTADEFAGQNVVVIGGGTSAIGFLLELEPVASHLAWATRRPVEWSDSESLDLEAAVAAVAAQDAAARAGRQLPSIVSGTKVPMNERIRNGIKRGVLADRPMFTRIEPTGVRWADGSFSPADALLWATGFRPEVRHLSALRLREAAGGLRVQEGASVADPRIFFAGYGPQASTIGAARAARRTARAILERLPALRTR